MDMLRRLINRRRIIIIIIVVVVVVVNIILSFLHSAKFVPQAPTFSRPIVSRPSEAAC